MVYQFLLWFIIFITIKVNIVEGILRYILFSEPPIYTSRLQQMTLSQATEPTVTRTKPSPGPQETKLRICQLVVKSSTHHFLWITAKLAREMHQLTSKVRV